MLFTMSIIVEYYMLVKHVNLPFERFQEGKREVKRLFNLASQFFDFKPLYAAIAKKGFHSFGVFPFEKTNGNFLNSKGCYV